jgi:hypothetical protein
MTNLQILKQVLESTKPTEGNFSINYNWLMQTLDMMLEAEARNVIINPAYLTAPIGIWFPILQPVPPQEPPIFDTW